jgi:hypothetical protein
MQNVAGYTSAVLVPLCRERIPSQDRRRRVYCMRTAGCSIGRGGRHEIDKTHRA